MGDRPNQPAARPDPRERRTVTKVDIGDLYRGAWLQTVSALDTFMHAEILRRVELAQSDGERPQELDRLRITIRDAEDMRLGLVLPAEVAVSAVESELARQTLQRPQAIAKALRFVTDDPIWRSVASRLRQSGPDRAAGPVADDVISGLNEVVERRNDIAHAADLLSDGSGDKRAISTADIESAIDLVESVVLALDAVLGDLPEVIESEDPAVATAGSDRRRNSVLLIQEHNVIADGTLIELRPHPAMREAIGAWLGEDPLRSVAEWREDGPSLGLGSRSLVLHAYRSDQEDVSLGGAAKHPRASAARTIGTCQAREASTRSRTGSTRAARCESRRPDRQRTQGEHRVVDYVGDGRRSTTAVDPHRGPQGYDTNGAVELGRRRRDRS